MPELKRGEAQFTFAFGSAQVACWALTLVGLALSCAPPPPPQPPKKPAAAVEPPPRTDEVVQGCNTSPGSSGLLLSCSADGFVLELPGLSEGFLWSFRRPEDPGTHVVLVAENSRKNRDLYSLSVLVGPKGEEAQNIAKQLDVLYQRLRRDTQEAARTNPSQGRDLSPARRCQTAKTQRPCFSYDIRGIAFDGRPAASTHAWTALRRDDGSVLFFHAAWAGYPARQRDAALKQWTKVDQELRDMLDAFYAIDAAGRRRSQ